MRGQQIPASARICSRGWHDAACVSHPTTASSCSAASLGRQVSCRCRAVRRLRRSEPHDSCLRAAFRDYAGAIPVCNFVQDLLSRIIEDTRMTDPIDQLDQWLRSDFVRNNTELEEAYFAQRTDVISGRPELDALKQELSRQGGV